MLEGNITITKAEYFELRCDKELHIRLIAGGIYNWKWFADSLNPKNGLSWSEFKNKLGKEIDNMKRKGRAKND